jgi:hypothetical protein
MWSTVESPCTSSPAITLSNLAPHTLYAIRISAHSSLASSHFSPASFLATTDTAPPAGPAPVVSGVTCSAVSLEWDWPSEGDGKSSRSVESSVEYACLGVGHMLKKDVRAAAWQRGFTGPCEACSISGLKSGCSYAFRVRGRRGAVYGLGGPVTVAMIKLAPPLPPSHISCTFQGATSLRITWAPQAGGALGHAEADTCMCALACHCADAIGSYHGFISI